MENTTSCIGCGIDREADAEIRSYYAIARDGDTVRGMTVNVRRTGCRHSYWLPITFATDRDASEWSERLNA